MKKDILFALVVSLVAFVSASVFAQQAEDNGFDTFHDGYQLVEVANNQELYSTTMTVNSIGGSAKMISEQDYVWNLQPGDVLVLKMNLPENSCNVKALVEYQLENNTAVGNIRINGKNYSDDTVALKMTENSQSGMFYKEIPLDDVSENNELRVFSVNGIVGIHNIKIVYDYRMPSSTDNGVTVVLTTPVSTDVLQENLRFEWKTQGPSEKGWVTLQYLDEETWKTVPGAEFIDCKKVQKGKTPFGEFVWKAHGLKVIPKVKITYHDYNTENVLPTKIPTQMLAVALSKIENDNQFLKTVNRLYEYENLELNNIKLTHTKIRKFEPTKRTWTEWCTFGYYSPESRRDVDMATNYQLLSKEVVAKTLNDFEKILKQTEILKKCVIQRQATKKGSPEEKQFNSVLKQIQQLQKRTADKIAMYISYSVVSPYLAEIERYYYWEEYTKAYIVFYCLEELSKEISPSMEVCLPDVTQQFQEVKNKLNK